MLRFRLVWTVVGAVVFALATVGCGSSPGTTPPLASRPSTMSSSAPTTSSTLVTTSATASVPATSGEEAAPTSDKRAAYLAALSAAGVPVSVSGDSEVLIAQGVCSELADGAARTKLVGDLAGMGGVMTLDRAEAVVAAAEQTYC